MTNTDAHDREQEVYNEILQLCTVPKTAETIAELWGCHPQTVRRSIWHLRDLGKLKECIRKENRKKLWQTVGGYGNNGELRLATTRGTVGMSDCANMYSEGATPVGNVIGGALAYLWTRSFYSQLDLTNVQNAVKMGTLDPLLHVRAVLADILVRAQQQVEILDQLVKDTPELFQDGAAPLNMMGPVDRMAMEDQARWFDAWVHAYLDRLT